MRYFYNYGKILLTAEYFVLKGSKALAVPLNRGQSLTVDNIDDSGMIYWKALNRGQEWFEAIYDASFTCLNTNNKQLATRLKKILGTMRRLKPSLFNSSTGLTFLSDTDFNREWGFGSSSTLILNLADWSGLDPYHLFREVEKGSGYDIAVGLARRPVIYQLGLSGPIVEPVKFRPDFRNNMFFVYSGRKTSSLEAVKHFTDLKVDISVIERISELTEMMAKTCSVDEFKDIITEHEKILSKTVKTDPVKMQYFSDFPGEVKSLGAWGGDFLLFVSDAEKHRLADYFREKKLFTYYGFDEIVLSGMSNEIDD